MDTTVVVSENAHSVTRLKWTIERYEKNEAEREEAREEYEKKLVKREDTRWIDGGCTARDGMTRNEGEQARSNNQTTETTGRDAIEETVGRHEGRDEKDPTFKCVREIVMLNLLFVNKHCM